MSLMLSCDENANHCAAQLDAEYVDDTSELLWHAFTMPSADGTRWKVTVDNTGTLVTTVVPSVVGVA